MHNWQKIQNEFDEWNKTIDRYTNIALAIVFAAGLLAIVAVLLGQSTLALVVVLASGLIAFFIDLVIGGIKIKEHERKIDEWRR